MSTIERFDERARHTFGEHGRTRVYDYELLRHPVYTRVLHWGVATFFILALLSGFGIYSPWLYRWIAPLFGGGPLMRMLHPWFSSAFVILFFFQFLNWLQPMKWTSEDSRWMHNLRAYVANNELLEPESVDFFNGGQKLYFWTIAASVILFVLSGVPMWFPNVFGQVAVFIGLIFHDIAALVMLLGFIIHIYEGASQPGTFQAMTRGTVEKRWAWTLHPAWYRNATGRDPRADYRAAAERVARVPGEFEVPPE